MRTTPLRMAGTALAAAVFAVACNSVVDSGEEAVVTAPEKPALTVGPLDAVQIVCPPRLQDGSTGYCYAFGVDSLGYFTGDQGGTFSTSTVNLIAMASNGNFLAKEEGTAVVNVTLSGVGGTLNVPIYNDVDPTVSIDGYPIQKPNQACPFVAQVSGGDAPYTYVWSVTSGSPSGSGSGDTWTGQAASGHYGVKVTVTDATGRVATGGHSVFITSAAPDC